MGRFFYFYFTNDRLRFKGWPYFSIENNHKIYLISFFQGFSLLLDLYR